MKNRTVSTQQRLFENKYKNNTLGQKIGQWNNNEAEEKRYCKGKESI